MKSAGNILLARNRGFVPWVIRTVTHSPYDHVGMFVKKNLLVEAKPRGVGLTDLQQYMDRQVDGKCQFVVYRLKNKEMLDVKKTVKFVEEFIGDEYDYWQIFKNFFRSVFHRGRTENDRKWTCSELVAEAYAAGGVLILAGCGLDFVSPGTFWRSELLEPDV